MKITERKGDIARNEQCLLFPQCFSLYRIDKLPAILRSSELLTANFFYLRESKIFAWQWLIVGTGQSLRTVTWLRTIDVRTNEILLYFQIIWVSKMMGFTEKGIKRIQTEYVSTFRKWNNFADYNVNRSQTLGEKKKMLVTSFFSFSLNVSYSLKDKIQVFIDTDIIILCHLQLLSILTTLKFRCLVNT